MSSINNNDPAQQARANFKEAQQMNNAENTKHAHATHATNSTQGVPGSDSYTQGTQGTPGAQGQGQVRLSQNAPIPSEKEMPTANDNGRAVGDAMGNAGGAGNVASMALLAQMLDLQDDKNNKSTKSTASHVKGEAKKDDAENAKNDQKRMTDLQLAALTMACPVVGLIMIAVEKSQPPDNSQNQNDPNKQNKNGPNNAPVANDAHSMGHMKTIVGPDGQVQVQTGGGQQGGDQHGGTGGHGDQSRGTQNQPHMQRPLPNSENEQSLYNQGAGMLTDASQALNETPQARKASQFG